MIVLQLINAFAKLCQVVLALISSLHLDADDYPPQADVQDYQSFDFIVVGAGSAGAVVASRLSEISNWTVLLIEAGDNPPIASKVPGFLPFMDSSVDWNYYSQNDNYSAQAHKTKTIPMRRGKMLGGCSGTNFMFYIRGKKDDYDRWESMGNEGWGWDSVFKYFKKSERLNDAGILLSPSASLHSTDGYLGVTRPLWTKRSQKYLDAFEQNEQNIDIDANGLHTLSYSMGQYTIDEHVRQSTAEAFLGPARKRINLSVLKKTTVRKVLFDENKNAIGVEAKLPCGTVVQLMADQEVILSAGAINSPQILMLSGIGPKEHLEENNINVLQHSPNVGKNLHDHSMVMVQLTERQTDFPSVLHNMDLVTNLNTFPTPLIIGHTAINKSQSYPDYQAIVFPLPAYTALSAFLCSNIFELEDNICSAVLNAGYGRETLFAMIALLHPESRGEIKLKDNNPESEPLIYTGYYSNTNDLENHAKYVEDYITVLNTKNFKSVKGKLHDSNVQQCSSYELFSHEYWKCYILNTAVSEWHPVGTCAMGPKGEGVVDARLRVKGVKKLRVVDASVIPRIVSGNPNAAVIMIAEKASDIIKAEYGIKTF